MGSASAVWSLDVDHGGLDHGDVAGRPSLSQPQAPSHPAPPPLDARPPQPHLESPDMGPQLHAFVIYLVPVVIEFVIEPLELRNALADTERHSPFGRLGNLRSG